MVVRGGHWRGIASQAEFSDDGTHRYWLTRVWGAGPGVCFIMLNPSRATESRTDNTVSFCLNRARDWGYGQMTVVNLFTFMSSQPDDLPGHAGRNDDLNDAVILRCARAARLRVAAWGGDTRFRDRAAHVRRLLADNGLALHCLGRTAEGNPRHPRAIPAGVQPLPWA